VQYQQKMFHRPTGFRDTTLTAKYQFKALIQYAFAVLVRVKAVVIVGDPRSVANRHFLRSPLLASTSPKMPLKLVINTPSTSPEPKAQSPQRHVCQAA
jgi:hypothetical protein